MKRTKPLLRTLPHFLTWRAFRFRTFVAAATKHLETFTEQFEIGSRVITLETCKIARFANGAVVLAMDNTNVLSTVTAAK
ncbi:polyribonucleotide nucleotidyltransferase 2, mitochondrial-like [Glycine soja]|uniref:polyribonucleotide nucleotidyltransferase 2, mitochondrial-like n=1 Tax=Glycine soja TaxID=3848 RepID=UPI001039337E|nr:polyribonucleotide nucleotidyltransferase 2, mitochondrial-like [Glycine soja]